MQIGDGTYGGFYAGKFNGHYIICSPIEYDLPFAVSWMQAIEYCKALRMELPTMGELNLLCEQFKVHSEYFPKRDYHWYWSSTESSKANAWSHIFTNGYQFNDNKTSNRYVRPIRRIKI